LAESRRDPLPFLKEHDMADRRNFYVSVTIALFSCAVIGAVCVRSIDASPGEGIPTQFRYLKASTYVCGGQKNQVKEFLHEPSKLTFVLIPEGKLKKPVPKGEAEATVTVPAFLMCKTEVTQEVWSAVMGNNPSDNKGKNLPVDSVTWVQAKAFCEKTSLALPTELEWEYACRAGTRSRYYWGDKPDIQYCWLEDNAVGRTRAVATRRPNAFGLYDMAGNVYEWCDSWYHKKGMSYDPANDRLKKGEKALRVLRSGSVASSDCCAMSSMRSGNWPAKTTPYDGLRPIARLAVKLSLGNNPSK
jgi:formylglycine-generating enzyme required for sulfatase activity